MMFGKNRYLGGWCMSGFWLDSLEFMGFAEAYITPPRKLKVSWLNIRPGTYHSQGEIILVKHRMIGIHITKKHKVYFFGYSRLDK